MLLGELQHGLYNDPIDAMNETEIYDYYGFDKEGEPTSDEYDGFSSDSEDDDPSEDNGSELSTSDSDEDSADSGDLPHGEAFDFANVRTLLYFILTSIQSSNEIFGIPDNRC